MSKDTDRTGGVDITSDVNTSIGGDVAGRDIVKTVVHIIQGNQIFALVILALVSIVAIVALSSSQRANTPEGAATRSLQSSGACDQPIRTATSTIEIFVVSSEDINTNFLDRGAYIGFGKGNEPLLQMSSTQSTARQTGDGQVLYRATVNMDVSDVAFGKPLRLLEDAEYVQINFAQISEGSQISTSKVTTIVNSDILLLESEVPMQEVVDGKIYIRGLNLRCTYSP